MILVTGAGGKTGRAVVQAFRVRGIPTRALARRPEQVDELQALGVNEALVGDLLDPSSLTSIFAGVRGVYHIGPNVHPAEVEMGHNTIAAAQSARVSHFVMHSVLKPRIDAMPHHWSKHLIEQQLFVSGLDYTVLQPASYMQNVRGVWDSVLAGRYPVPYPTDVRFSPVDLTDVAEVAATVLSEPGHTGRVYELCGPEVLTSQEMAAQMGNALGRAVEAVEIARDRWLEATELDAPRASTLIRMFEYYAEHGFVGNARVLTDLLCRAPTRFASYLREVGVEGASSLPE